MDSGKLKKDRLVFELMLVVVAAGMAYLFFLMDSLRIVALNLFYLPIVLSAYFLGRKSAGILAFFCVMTVTIASTLNTTGFAGFNSPILIALVITVWAAVLGLTALLVGTLSDARAAKIDELHEAYVGVVDVLSAYLQSANPKHKARSTRVAELSQQVATRMKLPPDQIDDVRIAALLHDMGSFEITTRLISRAVDSLGSSGHATSKHTFLGSDLVNSLGAVMQGAVPLVLSQNDDLRDVITSEAGLGDTPIPAGAKIIRAVRAFDKLMEKPDNGTAPEPSSAIRRLRSDSVVAIDPEVLDALERTVAGSESRRPLDAAPALA